MFPYLLCEIGSTKRAEKESNRFGEQVGGQVIQSVSRGTADTDTEHTLAYSVAEGAGGTGIGVHGPLSLELLMRE